MINPMMIMHPDDAKALDLLQRIKSVNLLARKAMEFGYERLYRGENLGEMIKVGPENFPRVHASLVQVTSMTGCTFPELFIYNSPWMNAYTYGDANPFIAISSAIVDRMDDQELKCILAHECGHILCRHTLYTTALAIIENLGAALQLVTEAAFLPILATLRYWSRCSELSADRCAAAVVGEEVFQKTLLELTCGLHSVQGSPYQLVDQAKDYQRLESDSFWDRLQQKARILFYTHPQMCYRALEVDRWKHSWQYRKINLTINQ